VLISARRTGAGAVIEGSAHVRDTARLFGLFAQLFDDAAPA